MMPDMAKTWSWFENQTHHGKNITARTITREPLESHLACSSTFTISNTKGIFKD